MVWACFPHIITSSDMEWFWGVAVLQEHMIYLQPLRALLSRPPRANPFSSTCHLGQSTVTPLQNNRSVACLHVWKEYVQMTK